MSNRTRMITAAIVVAITAAACSTPEAEPTTTTRGSILPSTTQPVRQQAVLASNALVPFDACDAFLDYIIPRALDMVGPYGLEGYADPWMWRGGPDVLMEFATTAAPAAEGDGGGSSAPRHSTTNLQEVGVDEPDLVKTDGERIVALTEGRLVVVDVTGDEPELVGELELRELSATDLFLSGDTVLLMASAWNTVYPVFEGDVVHNPGYGSPTVQLVEVSIDGDDPEIVRTMAIDGRYISARMVDHTVRLVLTSGPVGFAWAFPEGSGLKAERDAIEKNKDLVRNSTAENWIPYAIVTDADGDVVAEGTLFDCERGNHPKEFSGIDMLSVATIDLGAGLEVVDATGVLATGDTVYASTDSLYVATQQWQFWGPILAAEDDEERPEGVTTEIHKFDITDPTRATYVASGEIDGYLLNQFAMSEHEGLLRTASTTSPSWWGGGDFDTESLITVLEPRNGELLEIGRVDGLGKTERIFSVRFLDDVAYVVTFRQTDPLYTVDLSDPENPEVVGELKILGYSAYLHPLGDGLILGVGQDATETGRIQGTQVSVFDVSDPADPVRVAKLTLDEGSSSTVEWDHRAFLYWAETGLAVMPVQQWRWDDGKDEVWFGALAVTIDGDEIRDSERIVHPGGQSDDGSWDWRAQIVRTVIVDDAVYTISAKGILRSDLDTLDRQAWLRF